MPEGRHRNRAAIDLRIELDLPLSHGEVWAVVRDLPHFACVDPLHRQVTVLGPALEPGVRIAIKHGLFGISFLRYGRLLQWREGEGYAFSDLSAGGPDRGFPHVFFIQVTPVPAGGGMSTHLSVRIRGKWTAQWIPRPVQRLWLHAICSTHAWLLRRHFRRLTRS